MYSAPTNVPPHLRKYLAVQDERAYCAIDHAVWRYVMHRNVRYLGEAAYHAYLPGLKATGISLDRVPSVAHMNQCLAKFDWGAVVVDGLIPSAVFFEFQAHGLLPISVDIRTLEHIEYTPAPDIIHEAAGHAPILYDESYASYVRTFGRIGSKAFGTKAGHDVFDALRRLTIAMENPNSSPEEIREAERVLEEKRQVTRKESEESLLSRLYWWTVEYGLIGDLNHPKIFGAGLLSSVKESQYCMTEAVRKLSFDLEACIRTRYDLTKPQPQLFVCDSFEQLMDAVKVLAKRLAFRIGGTESLVKALESGRTATFVYSSGLQVTGTLSEVLYDDIGEAVYVRTLGPTALACADQQLPGHGKSRHKHGFGAPIGLLSGFHKPLEYCTDDELARLGIEPGREVVLPFRSGVHVAGKVVHVHRIDGLVVLVTFSDCTVTFRGKTLFYPGWGLYDMPTGATIISAYPGTADAKAFFEDADFDVKPATIAAPRHPDLADMYARIRELRDTYWSPADEELPRSAKESPSLKHSLKLLEHMSAKLDDTHPNDWLLRTEMLELATLLSELKGSPALEEPSELEGASGLEETSEVEETSALHGKPLVEPNSAASTWLSLVEKLQRQLNRLRESHPELRDLIDGSLYLHTPSEETA